MAGHCQRYFIFFNSSGHPLGYYLSSFCRWGDRGEGSNPLPKTMQPVSSRAGTLIQVQTQTITGIKTTDDGVWQPGLWGLTTQCHVRSGWPLSLRAGLLCQECGLMRSLLQRHVVSRGTGTKVHWEDGRQALCTEPDAWRPPDTVHCPHCRSGWNVSVLILEWSNSTAKKQTLNDTATLSLVLLPLATPNLTREMLPKSRSAHWGNFMSTLLFLGQGFSTLVFWVLKSASSL